MTPVPFLILSNEDIKTRTGEAVLQFESMEKLVELLGSVPK